MNKVIEFHIHNSEISFNDIKYSIEQGYNNFFIGLSQDYLKWSELDILKYKNFILDLSNIIYDEAIKNNIISINILTDIFMLAQRKGNDISFICNVCPCLHCHTMQETSKLLPNQKICRIKFIEYEQSIELSKKLKLLVPLLQINYEEFKKRTGLLS